MSLDTHAAYDRWAPTYEAEPHNPLMQAEQRAMIALLPTLAGRVVLDLACGTGRYARLAERAGARHVIALDYSDAMLARVATPARVRADMACLPFRDATFDAVVSGLALGHARDLEHCMREIARVLRPAGTLLYSDFHPEAIRRGLRRAFRATDGARHELPVDGHPVDRHLAGLRAAGFDEIEPRELRAGMGFDVAFPGAAAFYETWHGTPLVLTIRARRRTS